MHAKMSPIPNKATEQMGSNLRYLCLSLSLNRTSNGNAAVVNKFGICARSSDIKTEMK